MARFTKMFIKRNKKSCQRIINPMDNLPRGYILTFRPKEYLQQGLSHCGVYSIKGILSAFGKDKTGHPKEYHPGWFGRITGMTLGRQYYINILRRYGINAVLKSAAKLNTDEKISLLKSILAKNTPIMMRIGNGYNTDKYEPLFGRLQGHWITLWGYDDSDRIFYVYDSGLPRQYWNVELPIGNTTRTYEEIIRDWNFGLWQFWTWPFLGIGRNQYIEIQINNPAR